MLSEVKLEVETVIKTGRQIVQKQQTENPKAMDEQLTALKLLYNDLGAQVTYFLGTFKENVSPCSTKGNSCWFTSNMQYVLDKFKTPSFLSLYR